MAGLGRGREATMPAWMAQGAPPVMGPPLRAALRSAMKLSLVFWLMHVPAMYYSPRHG